MRGDPKFGILGEKNPKFGVWERKNPKFRTREHQNFGILGRGAPKFEGRDQKLGFRERETQNLEFVDPKIWIWEGKPKI